jgi:hypothetical protein
MRTPWVNLGLLVCATAFSLALMEITSRFVYPVSAGPEFITPDGSGLASWNDPGRTYRQVSREYDAITTITSKGYRIPEVRGNPTVIFIGDSYTFGVGLSDKETFPFQYALSKKETCANLALPGWGTGEAIDRLEEALSDWGWRPRHVMLFMFAMTTSMAGGNDIVDNLAYRGKDRSDRLQKTVAQRQSTLWSKIYNYLRFQVLSFSNLARILKFHLGSQVRSVVTLRIDEQQLKQSLEMTRRQLLRLQYLSNVHGFSYEIFLIHPVQDIMRGTADHTHQALQRISPVPIRDTAQLFLKNPAAYYYAYDGHLNANGSAAIAKFLLSGKK